MLKSTNIYLRTIEPTDVDILVKWENNPDNWKVSNTLVPFSKFLITQYVNSAQDIFETKQIRFIICMQETDEPIGTIDLFEYDPFHQRAGVGVLIEEKKDRNKGFAGEAIQLIMEYGFEHLQLHGLFCNINETNKASIYLFEKHGFVQTGIKKDWVITKEGWEDELFYQLIKE